MLKDSPSRPGRALRGLLRDGKVRCVEQVPPGKHGNWFIVAAAGATDRVAPIPLPRLSRTGSPAAPAGAFALTENDVVEAVCNYLVERDFTIVTRAHTTQQGVDVVATRSGDGVEIRVEAKGGTSSKQGTNRFGKAFSSSRVSTHVAKAFFTAASATRGARARSAMALPDMPRHRKYLERVGEARGELGVGVLWVGADQGVELDAAWSLDADDG